MRSDTGVPAFVAHAPDGAMAQVIVVAAFQLVVPVACYTLRWTSEPAMQAHEH
jgi:hypothetical protein